MGKRFVKVALCQRSASGTKEENLADSIRMIEEATAENTDLDVILFPEYNYYTPSTAADSVSNAEPIPGTYVEAMAAQARKHRVNIIPGTLAEYVDDKKSKNTCPFIDRDGAVTARYSKVHMMDAIGMAESSFTVPGDEICVFDTDFGRVGIMVCFDLRFPEMARSMVLNGAEIIFCVANFPCGNPLPPRTDHWDGLVKSTALYNLTWTCAVNQYGPVSGEFPFGRSSVADPWGTVTASASGGRAIVYATLDMEYQQEIRNRVATWECRRPDVYTL